MVDAGSRLGLAGQNGYASYQLSQNGPDSDASSLFSGRYQFLFGTILTINPLIRREVNLAADTVQGDSGGDGELRNDEGGFGNSFTNRTTLPGTGESEGTDDDTTEGGSGGNSFTNRTSLDDTGESESTDDSTGESESVDGDDEPEREEEEKADKVDKKDDTGD